jgi:hypothetical protein
MKFDRVESEKGLLGRLTVELEGRSVVFPVFATSGGFRFGSGETVVERRGFVVRLPGAVDPKTVEALSSLEAIDVVVEGLDGVR